MMVIIIGTSHLQATTTIERPKQNRNMKILQYSKLLTDHVETKTAKLNQWN